MACRTPAAADRGRPGRAGAVTAEPLDLIVLPVGLADRWPRRRRARRARPEARDRRRDRPRLRGARDRRHDRRPLPLRDGLVPRGAGARRLVRHHQGRRPAARGLVARRRRDPRRAPSRTSSPPTRRSPTCSSIFVAWSTLSVVWARELLGAAVNSSFRYLPERAPVPDRLHGRSASARHAVWAARRVRGRRDASRRSSRSSTRRTRGPVRRRARSRHDRRPERARRGAGRRRDPGAACWSRSCASSPILRLAAAVAAVLCAAGSSSTFSRGGLVALGVRDCSRASFVGGRWRGRGARDGRGRGRSSASASSRCSRRRRDATASRRWTAAPGRTDIWTVGWRMVAGAPDPRRRRRQLPAHARSTTCSAPGAVTYDYFIDHPKVAHNTYLQVLAELGFVGLGLFLSIIAFALVCAFKAARTLRGRGRPRHGAADARAAARADRDRSSADFFISGQFSKQLWLLLGLGPAMLAIAKTRARRQALGSF